ncbi:MAG: hypothetical protein GF309_03930 [Candidatus Lokiarchaeota archaeon]|jgi:hypothetical protein|nr:hypothetical protein [Candidatus Lokiarchaeota archaeon]
MNDLSPNEQCVLEILEHEGPLSTAELIKTSRSSEYSHLCSGCAGGDAILTAAKSLLHSGSITRNLDKDGYRWDMKVE